MSSILLDGGIWLPWGLWTECSVTCSEGVEFRGRACRGNNCHGEGIQSKVCTRPKCQGIHLNNEYYI